MKLMSRTLCAMLLLLTPFSALANAATHQFRFNYQHLANNDPAHSPKVVEASSLTINGVKMVTFNTTFENPNEMSVLHFRAKALKSKIKAEYLKKFDLYGMPNGNVFVPAEWQLVYADLAKNGALTYTFVPPDGQDGYLTYTHTADCLPCAEKESAFLFLENQHDGRQQHHLKSSNTSISSARLKADLIAYRAKLGANHIDGVMYYNAQKAAFPFWKVEIGLPQEQADLVNPLLNQFITLHETW